MTMCLASFDMKCSGAVWSSAGHDPPIIFDSVDRIFQDPEVGEVPLGVMEGVEYGNYKFGPLGIGTIVFLGSDGVWEMFSESGEQYGKERLKRAIALHADESAQQICKGILQSLESFRGGASVKDDVTF